MDFFMEIMRVLALFAFGGLTLVSVVVEEQSLEEMVNSALSHDDVV